MIEFLFLCVIAAQLYVIMRFNNSRLQWQVRAIQAELKAMQFEAEARTDVLTGCKNRRYMDGVIAGLTDDRRVRKQFAILAFDIDHFKQINDTYGHDVGDKVLQDFSSLLRDCVRNSDDVVARMGGEEFLAVLRGVTEDTAYFVAEKLRMTVEQFEFTNGIKITCSIGMICRDSKDIYDANQLVIKADEALYKAKNSGRNQVVVAD